MKKKMRLLPCLLIAAWLPSSTMAEVRVDLLSGYAFAAGDAANGASLTAQVSPDGRFVALSSEAVNLVAGFADRNGEQDALVLDRQSGVFDYVSVAAGGALTADGVSTAIAVSNDGRWVLFASTARDLIAGASYPGNLSEEQLYLFDRVDRSTRLVSHAPGNPLLAGDRSATGIGLSADGRFVLFESAARNLVSPPAATGTRQVYHFDRDSGGVRLVTHKALEPNTLANGLSDAIDMSADGGVVLFESRATDLPLGYTDSHPIDVFVWDRLADSYQLISRLAANPTATSGGRARDLSADGRFVLLDSVEIGIAAGVTDGNGAGSTDVFVIDRQSGSARLASPSAASATVSADGGSFGYRLSDDGRYVYLESTAQNLVAPFTDGNGAASRDLYVFDAQSGAMALVSHAAGDASRGGNARMGLLATPQALSPDGRHALYESLATDLESGVTDTNGELDLYLYDRQSGVSSLVSRRGATLEAGAFERGSARVIAGGETLFASLAALDPAVADPQPQLDVFTFAAPAEVSLLTKAVFAGVSPWPGGSGNSAVLSASGRFAAFSEHVWDRQGGGFAERVAHAAGQPSAPGNFPSVATAITSDGRFVLLDSRATDLAAGVTDGNNQRDVLFYDRNVDTAFLVSAAAGQPATTANGDSTSRAGGWLSADARQIVLHSTATNLLPGQAGTPSSYPNLFFHDRPSGTTALISHHYASPTHSTENGSYLLGVSADGRYLIFESGAHDLISGFVDGNDYFSDDFGLIHVRDLYFYDRVTRWTTLISHRPGQPSHGELQAAPSNAWLSADASAVYYTSLRLTETEVGPATVYRWDRATNTNAAMAPIGGGPLTPCADEALTDITPHGEQLLVDTPCAFVPGDTNEAVDAYLIDRTLGMKILVMHQAGNPAVAAGGRGKHLSSLSRRAVYLDPAGVPHSYDFLSQQSTRLTSSVFDAAQGVPATVLGASDTGNQVLLATRESDLAPYDGNGTWDLYLATLADLFADGFESGSTGGWTLTLP